METHHRPSDVRDWSVGRTFQLSANHARRAKKAHGIQGVPRFSRRSPLDTSVFGPWPDLVSLALFAVFASFAVKCLGSGPPRIRPNSRLFRPQSARRPGGLSCVLLPFLCRVNRARVRCRADQSADRVGSVCIRSPACATPGFRLTPRPRLAYPCQPEFRSATWRGSSAAGGGARLGSAARRPRKANLLSPRIRPGPMGSSRGPCPVGPWAPSSLTISSAEVIAVGALRRSIENELDSCRNSGDTTRISRPVRTERKGHHFCPRFIGSLPSYTHKNPHPAVPVPRFFLRLSPVGGLMAEAWSVIHRLTFNLTGSVAIG